jgi:hypothetical protein
MREPRAIICARDSKQSEKESGVGMADRKQFFGEITTSPELVKALEESRHTVVTEDELREQRISFAFGNAPANARNTKDSVRQASEHIRLLP